ncbi:hypothetical protein BU24DRAFT_190199 [Aaosphaeria arxii CBS 175.79]|uniref:Uncharacterized protein n=1 Tax=Aaosphaeria arxii CBS 175.79 TaxID=1450172 RepID=A0A6A5XRV0_9PLEO|nr:uncharacterized protein BU24DRAFT_190199 [Aaosphaeria arxii CBS 175.79]KAF2016018.1 hypothetical protein BU24DRAFT_190199 [Aaosphaeria arxii CBS 175.79]
MSTRPENSHRYVYKNVDRSASQSTEVPLSPGLNEAFRWNDIAGFGGLFRDTKETYPPLIDLSEDEDGERSPLRRTSTLPKQAQCHQLPDRPCGPARIRSTPNPTTSHNHPSMRLNSEPYLRHEDVRRYLERRDRQPQSGNSVYTVSSEYHSAIGHPTYSVTEVTEDEEDIDTRRERRSFSVPTPVFTPRHTPPPASEGTDEREVEEYKEPTSPNPFSAYYPYNPDHGENAVGNFEKLFTARQ